MPEAETRSRRARRAVDKNVPSGIDEGGLLMSEYLVAGAGTIGASLASALADQHHQVRLVSRSGSGPEDPNITRVAADTKDAHAIRELAEGTLAVFNCVNPAYHRWPTDWPPVADSLLACAEGSGAVLVTLSNLYGYGRPTGPMSPDSPMLADYEKAQVRVKMWRDAKAAHDAGRLRAAEVRASDYIGPRAESAMGERVFPRILAGKGCQILGGADVPHSWTYTGDVVATLIACAQNPQAWGKAWHVPTNPPRTQRQVIDDIADAAGVARVKVTPIPLIVLRASGIFSPVMRELPKTMYQFSAPFIIDDAETRRTLGLEPTPWSDVLGATIASYRAR
jgi:nucleoside-diphosphate-sugar epimerase